MFCAGLDGSHGDSLVIKEDGMRPWMKWLAVSGIFGVALSISLAADRPSSSKDAPRTKSKSASRPGRLEFFNPRGDAEELAVELDAQGADDETAAAASSPKRYVRSKVTPIASDGDVLEPEPLENLPSAKPISKAVSDSSDLPTESTGKKLSQLKMSTRRATNVPETKSSRVEFLPAPSADEPSGIAGRHKLTQKKSISEIQPAGFDSDLVNLAEENENPSSDNEQKGSTKKIQTADFQQRPQTKSKIQPVHGTSNLELNAEDGLALPEISTPQASPRVSVIQERTQRPATFASSRSLTTEARSASSSVPAATPSVTVAWVKKSRINVGQECACDLVVTNNGKVAARDLVVEALFPESVRLTKANPEPTEASDHLEWLIRELPAGAERVIQITMIPSQRGELATTAKVRFTGTAASVFSVEEPLLKIAVNAPAEAIIGDPLVQTITVSNPGTGVAQNVALDLQTSKGLELLREKRTHLEIGALNAGESRSIRISFAATAGGEQTLTVRATGDAELNTVAESTIRVIAPELAVSIEGPEAQTAGRTSDFVLTVVNKGQAVANNVRVSQRVPQGFQFIKAGQDGHWDAKAATVSWHVGQLQAGETKELRLELQAGGLGEFEHVVVASSDHSNVARATTTTNVDGTAEINVEVVDLDDPVAVGTETAYEVRVSNVGAKVAQNVGLALELSTGLELLNVEAATKHISRNGLILFNDLPQLAPGKTALYRVYVRGHSDGDLRVRARVTSESIPREVITQEQTKFVRP
jgi:uncharacterized repeat protein (TIGR01451 family)